MMHFQSTLNLLLNLLVSCVLCVGFQIVPLKKQPYTVQNESSKDLVRYRGRIAYDGTGFDGWQTQTKGRTIQGEMEAILSRRFDRPVRILGAGRTDAGVHARGQAFHFDLTHAESAADASLERTINSMSRLDMRVYNLHRAPDPEWHAIRSSRKKLYSYRFSIDAHMCPLSRHVRTHVYEKINLGTLSSVLSHFEGTNDFRAFAGAIEQNERKKGVNSTNTLRTVYSAKLIHEENGFYKIDFYLNGALYKMVRNMVGTALDVSKGILQEERLTEFLEIGGGFQRKDNPCKPAPPQGLTLEHVFYPDGF